MKKVQCYELIVCAVVEGRKSLLTSVTYFESRKARSAFRTAVDFYIDKPYYDCLYGSATSVDIVLNKVTIDEEYIVLDSFSRSFV